VLKRFFSILMASSAKQPKLPSSQIGTHNGSFHCDEVLACFLLKQLPEYVDAEIVRSRDPSKLDECDIVVDVGGVFDAEKKRFDHHQKSFTHTYASLVPAKKDWTIKLSSAGLVYLHYGERVLSELLTRVAPDLTAEDKKKLKAILFDKMYENFVKEIDGIDNGVEIAETKAYSINTNLSARVGFLNPDWNSKG
jgi:uncharacterized UPF0160 family protein